MAAPIQPKPLMVPTETTTKSKDASPKGASSTLHEKVVPKPDAQKPLPSNIKAGGSAVDTSAATTAAGITKTSEIQSKTATDVIFEPGLHIVRTPDQIIGTLQKMLDAGKKPVFVFDFDGVFTESNKEAAPTTSGKLPTKARNKAEMLKLMDFMDKKGIPCLVLTAGAAKVSSIGNTLLTLMGIKFSGTAFAKNFPLDKHPKKDGDRENVKNAQYPYIQSHLSNNNELIVASGCIAVANATDKDLAVEYVQERVPQMTDLLFIDDALGNAYDIYKKGKQMGIPTTSFLYEADSSYHEGSMLVGKDIDEAAGLLKKDPKDREALAARIKSEYDEVAKNRDSKESTTKDTRKTAVVEQTKARSTIAARKAEFLVSKIKDSFNTEDISKLRDPSDNVDVTGDDPSVVTLSGTVKSEKLKSLFEEKAKSTVQDAMPPCKIVNNIVVKS